MLLAPARRGAVVLGFAGPAYGVVAAFWAINFLRHAFAVWRMADGDAKMVPAKKLFGFSIFYLFGIFAMLLVDTRDHACSSQAESDG